jgi:hypothetical protein
MRRGPFRIVAGFSMLLRVRMCVNVRGGWASGAMDCGLAIFLDRAAAAS